MAQLSKRTRSDPSVGGIQVVRDPWTAAMLRGDFARAWQISDAILAERIRAKIQCWHWPRHEQFLWRGESLANKRVLVHCYHGLGDTLQFARLLTPLSKIAAEVIVWVQPKLQDIVATIDGVAATHPLHDGAPEIERDIDIELMELPHALRIDAATLPCAVPYINVGVEREIENSARFQVGLVWRSGEWNRCRSLDLANVNFLVTGTREIEWHSFQFDTSHALPTSLKDLSCKDIAAMGRQLRRMDLLITVDTMAAHLAGALGLPVWLLLPHECDWRWMSNRNDSPWYPTMRLFRQPRAGAWREVVMAVGKALGEANQLTSRPAREEVLISGWLAG